MSDSMSRPRRSRGIALVASPLLALGALAAVPAASYAATDPTPAANGAAWLAGELTDGALVGEFGPDYGLTIDAGRAMLAVGAQPAAVTAITDTVEANLNAYVTGEAFGDTGSLYSGAVSKVAAFVTAQGGDATDFGGRDLVADIEGVASDAPATEGRLADTSMFGDFANTIGQSFAVQALVAADSPEVAAVTDFLLAQQCSEGFFRLSFAAVDAADQTCDGDPASSASTDVTAFAALALVGLDDPAAAAALDDAAAWLIQTQGADGSWGSDSAITAANANSTGLAAWALSEIDTPAAAAAAERGAINLRGLQADDFAPCATELTGDTGAIAYDRAALANARKDGMGALTDQFRRATAQALPALLVAPAVEAGFSETRVSFVRAGSRQSVEASDLAPGQTVCFSGRGTQRLRTAAADGSASTSVVLPDGTGTRVYRIRTSSGTAGRYAFDALAKTTFAVTTRSVKVKQGETQRITVKGLANGESVTVRFRGKVVGRGVDGRSFTTSFKVGKMTGRQKVSVVGEFGNRTGATAFRIVKR